MGNSAQRWRESQQRFKLAMRGYDPLEVDAFLAQLSHDPDLPTPSFAHAMRGYDADQVDLHIEHVRTLSRQPPF